MSITVIAIINKKKVTRTRDYYIKPNHNIKSNPHVHLDDLAMRLDLIVAKSDSEIFQLQWEVIIDKRGVCQEIETNQ